jgi:NTP pyrophosphatase (non-canonical NTP hydrolase)
MNDIIDIIGLPAVLEQLAEECSELAQASLKYARLLRGDNPTPKTEQEWLEAITEEMADVELCNSLLTTADHVDFDAVMELIEVKDKRWHKRIQEAHHEDS